MADDNATFMTDMVYVTPQNRAWRDSMNESSKRGAAIIVGYIRSHNYGQAFSRSVTWADVVEGDVPQQAADIINDVLSACEAAGFSRATVLGLVS